MYVTENILDMIENLGEDSVIEDLSSFSSPLNNDIEKFIKNNAIEFAKKKMSVTYVVNDSKDGEILGYFTLTIKPLVIDREKISNTLAKKVERYSFLDNSSNSYTVASFLLAQFGKNYDIDNGKRVTISGMMNEVEKVVKEIQHMIGGGLIYLDVEAKNEKVINLYKLNTNYVPFSERTSNNKSYIMMIKAV